MRKKILSIITYILMLCHSAVAQEVDVLKIEIDKIIELCGPQISDKYVPDLVLKQQYNSGAECLKNNILEQAKIIFDTNRYEDFQKYLEQTSVAYLQMVQLLNEQTIGNDGVPGTLDMLNTQSDWYKFLRQILTKIMHYKIQLLM